MMNPSKIKAIRKRFKLTQQQLANKLCVSVNMVQKYEAGEHTKETARSKMSPSVQRLLELLEAGIAI